MTRLTGRYVSLHGSIRSRDHLADALIVVSTSRVRGLVRTHNFGHMQGWADLLKGYKSRSVAVEQA